MGLVTVQSRHFVQFAKFSVYTDLGISALAHLLQEFLIVAFPTLDNRSKKVALAVLVIFHDQGYDLLVGITDHGLTCLRRICGRCARIKKSQEVIDFRYRADSRAGIVSRRLLFDRDYRAEACNLLDFRLFQYAHEMFRISGQGIHIPSLSFCIYRIECKRRLSAAAEARHNHEPAARNRKAGTFQIVCSRPLDLYIFVILHH